jgi:hypothetical protein
MWHVANAKRADGDVDAAIALFADCAEVARRRGLSIGEMVACNALGEIWEERAVLDESRRFWERALQCRRAIDAVNVGHIHGSTPLNLLAIARVAARQGELATASKLLREALPIAHQIRDQATAQQIAELLAKTSKVEPTHSATLRPVGGVWDIAFNGASVHVPDMKGLWHLRDRHPVLKVPAKHASCFASPRDHWSASKTPSGVRLRRELRLRPCAVKGRPYICGLRMRLSLPMERVAAGEVCWGLPAASGTT